MWKGREASEVPTEILLNNGTTGETGMDGLLALTLGLNQEYLTAVREIDI